MDAGFFPTGSAIQLAHVAVWLGYIGLGRGVHGAVSVDVNGTDLAVNMSGRILPRIDRQTLGFGDLAKKKKRKRIKNKKKGQCPICCTPCLRSKTHQCLLVSSR